MTGWTGWGRDGVEMSGTFCAEAWGVAEVVFGGVLLASMGCLTY